MRKCQIVGDHHLYLPCRLQHEGAFFSSILGMGNEVNQIGESCHCYYDHKPPPLPGIIVVCSFVVPPGAQVSSWETCLWRLRYVGFVSIGTHFVVYKCQYFWSGLINHVSVATFYLVSTSVGHFLHQHFT